MQTALKIGVYIFLYVLAAMLFGPILGWIGGYLFSITLTGFFGSILTNALCLRIYEHRRFTDAGLPWGAGAVRNLALGLAGGSGAAIVVLSGPLLTGAAHFRQVSGSDAAWSTFIFVSTLLLFGAVGEEMLFRGYGFQVLLRACGPYATILPVGILFAALHAGNPHTSYLGLLNTAGFGVLFGYAFLRSGDLWLPIALHFGWNLTLPLFGVNLSGITMKVTGYAIEWTAGPLWSGGEYGPEASILTSGVLAGLGLYLWKAPIWFHRTPLLGRPPEE